MKKYNMGNLELSNIGIVHYNLSPAKLVEKALQRKEGLLSDTGAFIITTGKYTGRSPDDKFIVDTPDVHEYIGWGDVNHPIDRETFHKLYERALAYLQNREVFVFNGLAGADKKYQKKFRFINEYASQNLFIHQLLIRPNEEELKNYGEPDFTILSVPGFKCIPEIDGVQSEVAIIIDFEAKLGIICGTSYSGELKKMVFSIMNYLMPHEGVLPMHCSANMDPETKKTAIFFGLSGTGKTTLSADPNRILIGDDEHGWSEEGIFNFEGGCYAKCINLNPETEPDIYYAIKFGSIVENVVVDEKTREIDYADNSLTQNTRVAYPLHYINNSQYPSVGGKPSVIIFLTADSFGVLPPVAKLTKEAAMYHFITGFTAKLAGTERGVKEPIPTFSTCFGEPFMPMEPSVYAKMLGEKIEKYNTQVYLINTGWSGGAYGTGQRMNLKYTRAMVTAVLNGALENVEYKHDEIFNVEIPKTCPEVPSEILSPINTWQDKEAYIKAAKDLAQKFVDNFAKKYPNMPKNIVNAGPKV
ncbi:phosphoenolpyruvate carboxykinase (ATP) [Fusobacterium russii]|uniref:phosphoenolpyruvate carboxykinase (ATP) n=1 Tax=Fusobacterium russii TaxID=854 RepID=UPI00039AED20|nr:phosphoenolpyruvate carboxykinase (ATP) [Fusobacterium russii]